MKRLVCLTLFLITAMGSSAAANANAPANVKLRVTVGGGTVGVVHVTSPRGNHPGCLIDCTYRYPVGTRVTMKAQPAANVTRFIGWSGACSGHKRICVLTLRKNTSVIARFALGA